MKETLHVPGIELRGAILPGFEKILGRDALEFVAGIERRFRGRLDELLVARRERQSRIDEGERPDFLEETAYIRWGNWSVAPVPMDLRDRRVEITGPVDRKMIINALNSGASAFMADFEDSTSPTWENIVGGQVHLRDAVQGTIEFTSPAGRRYALGPGTATLLVRPRGLHLVEKHALIDGRAASAALFDFALFFFHNARRLIEKGSGPYFYLPKLESRLEARLWDDVFRHAQDELGIPQGTVKATVLIETITAAFEMEEILWELREHSAGLNCGRWDYIFSVIKKFRNDPAFVLPDRARVTMTTPFLRNYSRLLIQTCHRRGAHAMGGMAAQIPIRGDEAANEAALRKVEEDKEREVRDGHDGTWVAHPGLIPVAREVFDRHMPRPNQIDRRLPDQKVDPAELLVTPDPAGGISEAGLRNNLRVGVVYLGSWLGGSGCVPIYHLMEDAATAEICRAQVWQWIRHDNGVLDDGRKVTADLARRILAEELQSLRAEVGDDAFASGNYETAAGILTELITSEDFVEFLTLPAYEHL